MKFDSLSHSLAGFAALGIVAAGPVTVKLEGRRNAPHRPRLARTFKRSSPVNVELTDWFEEADFQVRSTPLCYAEQTRC